MIGGRSRSRAHGPRGLLHHPPRASLTLMLVAVLAFGSAGAACAMVPGLQGGAVGCGHNAGGASCMQSLQCAMCLTTVVFSTVVQVRARAQVLHACKTSARSCGWSSRRWATTATPSRAIIIPSGLQVRGAPPACIHDSMSRCACTAAAAPPPAPGRGLRACQRDQGRQAGRQASMQHVRMVHGPCACSSRCLHRNPAPRSGYRWNAEQPAWLVSCAPPALHTQSRVPHP